ncbi:PLC-like phosphodiesterase, TIM beta/alpha-barrel domain protein [Ascosphaera apis ARSEF 7405]|uniref:PLC-like phosphodiesterase, TIM beta/alpha-barrel domain protein n=1 Tax=Ascosphaera apis ARSEF 7405 TaxID=392613 RepID=A0A167YHK9_9EURO|nr:PLC-like phosphodiesterase, TIM beta/alpha-barrel domain protein [Ascosphaera apis ARSEF 7405]
MGGDSDRLTIRNLTAGHVILAQVQRYPQQRAKFHLCPKPQQEEPIGESFYLRIGPYETCQTDIPLFVSGENERLRLTFAAFRGRHFVHLPHTNTPDDNDTNTPNRLYAVFIRSQRHLTLYQLTDESRWMESLRDDLMLSALSIPGTHNSPTCYKAPPSVRCQAVSVREQLEHGVRFLDLRMHPDHAVGGNDERDKLVLVHSVFPISFSGKKTFRRLLEDIEDFLRRNPSEALLVSIKREGPGHHNDQQLSRVLYEHYANNNDLWYTKPTIPTLGEARGKIVLLRRFNIADHLKKEWNGEGWGIDATGWADNTPHALCKSGTICIQDFYEIPKADHITEKVEYIKGQIRRAAMVKHRDAAIRAAICDRTSLCLSCPLYINFLSASNFWKLRTWPKDIAAKVNPQVTDYLAREHTSDEGDWSTGILVCDWVGRSGDWTLVKSIIGMNSWLKIDHDEHYVLN